MFFDDILENVELCLLIEGNFTDNTQKLVTILWKLGTYGDY